jgi:hypothetical protein
MPKPLPLESFEVEGYRAIRHLRLRELGRVNLFVGKNNAGKTSLLEAIRIYFSLNPGAELFDIIRTHAGMRPGLGSLAGSAPPDPQELRWAVDACLGIISGSYEDEPLPAVRFGPVGHPDDTLTISLPWLAAYREGQNSGIFFSLNTPLINVSRSAASASLPLEWLLRSLPVPPRTGETGVVHIPAGGLDSDRLFFMWRDTVALGDAENAEEVLRAIIPDFERVFVLDHSLFLKLRGTSKPIPLESMGDGTNRVFGIALAFLRGKGGTVLIDEVENGFHHTIQHEVWDSIFSLAEELDVQVFATTHSWEAVVAFQYAANRSQASGMLYRLERDADGSVSPVRYTEDEVAIAADQQIEVR